MIIFFLFYLDNEPVECKKLTSKDTGIYADDFEELDEGDYSDDFESSIDDDSEDEENNDSDKNNVKYFSKIILQRKFS